MIGIYVFVCCKYVSLVGGLEGFFVEGSGNQFVCLARNVFRPWNTGYARFTLSLLIPKVSPINKPKNASIPNSPNAHTTFARSKLQALCNDSDDGSLCIFPHTYWIPDQHDDLGYVP